MESGAGIPMWESGVPNRRFKPYIEWLTNHMSKKKGEEAEEHIFQISSFLSFSVGFFFFLVVVVCLFVAVT